ncbi:MAG TPA: hypothetical protein VK816_06000, partial [Jatrophihabitantaceae bacterium]|nr:hypothetical protein [Jatrophihabitantaceae bacterium]
MNPSPRPAPASRGDAGPKKMPFVLLVTGLLVGGLWALLALNTASAANELQARELTSASAGTQNQVEQLQVEVAAEQAPSALASAATGLGMVPDTNPVFLIQKPDGSFVVMGSPAPVSSPSIPLRASGASNSTTANTPTSTSTRAATTASAPVSTSPL